MPLSKSLPRWLAGLPPENGLIDTNRDGDGSQRPRQGRVAGLGRERLVR